MTTEQCFHFKYSYLEDDNPFMYINDLVDYCRKYRRYIDAIEKCTHYDKSILNKKLKKVCEA